MSDIGVMCLLEDRPNLSLIGKNSNCGKFLAVLFLFSFISLLINFGLFLLIIICQAAVIYLDAKKIREENNNTGPNPIVYAFLTLVFWIIIVPFYIVYRQRFEEKGSSCENPKKPTFKTNATENRVLKSQINTKSQLSLNNEMPEKNMEHTHNNYHYGSRGRYGDYTLKSDMMIKPVNKFIEGPIEVNHNISASFNNSPIENLNLSNSQTSTKTKKSSYYDINQDKKFKIDIISEREDQPQSETITWAGDSTEIRIINYLIQNPLIYWTNNPTVKSEPSCINLNLTVGSPIDEPEGSLNYWCGYSGITPDQRATYLSWLSSGRKGELSDSHYLSLFFCGLEYRAIVEKKDISIIIQEVNSLLKRYPNSSNFFHSGNNFLAYVAAQQLTNISDDNFSHFFQNPIELSHYQVLVALTWYLNNDKPISWEIAYSLANTVLDTQKSIITQKLSKQFRQLFATKFMMQYPDGFKIKPLKKTFNYRYPPVNPSLSQYFRNNLDGLLIGGVEIINPPRNIKSQFSKIINIWSDCIEELKPASRKISKGEQELTAQAYQLLPDLLKREINHPDKSKWDDIFTKSYQEGEPTLISISSLTNLIHIEKRVRLTPAQSKFLFSTARDIGYILIPDPRITGTPYRWNDNVAMYPLPNKGIFTSESYPTVAFILELGMSIGLADGSISQEELDHLERFIFGSFELTPFDIECLKQYQQILILYPPSLEKLGTRLKEHLTETNKLIIAKYLRDMASVDGTLDPNEYKALNKIFKSMGLGKDDFQTLFPSDLTKKPSEQPIQISQSSSAIIGETITPKGSIPSLSPLDYNLIKKIFQDSLDAQNKLIENLNQDDEEETEIEPKPISLSTPESKSSSENFDEKDFLGLHPKYISFLKDVTEADTLSKVELLQICRNYGFMMNAAIEEINTWSEEHCKDYLFESTDEDEILFNLAIKENIKEKLI